VIFALVLALTARVEITATNDTTVTYRERLPRRVALEPDLQLYHFKGCPRIMADMEWVVPAAAQLRAFAPHAACASLAKDEYATRTERRAPRDPNVVSLLFLGNSLTYFNEMPAMTREIASREKRPLHVDAVTRSGVTLEQLWNETDALRRLWLRHWDYVVVQGGAGAAGPTFNTADFDRYLTRFAAEIRKSGAKPLFYLVWRGRSQKELEAASMKAAERERMPVVPVGVAWRRLIESGRFRRLDWDGSHPDAFGAYLIACTVYSTVYGKPAHAKPYDFRHLAARHETYDDALRQQTITPEDARAIQDAAWRAVQSVKSGDCCSPP
jgi:hypothetical protein